MKNPKALCMIIVALSFPLLALAHEGHKHNEHKMMGIIKAVDTTHIDLESKEGEKATAVVDKNTKYLRGKAPVAISDVKVGERAVIVMTDDNGKMLAKQVLLSTSGKSGH